ncbi:hypothetical protein PYCCODRAFT_329477 [Trametes coccinea BRFM310]|uniref:Transmembrane protein n=1 Tax=Trametes coccinea (strain BRFM310) TaxID=1353009 RepID=A0A1Y2ING0_TRAC3|nr:hypothetical protein PYCCODRAFT_329477 [Trametes coccinea BRFM310]
MSTSNTPAASTSQTPLPSSSTAPNAIPTFAFTPIPTLQTCSDASIRWSYNGLNEEMSFFVSLASTSPPQAPSLIAYPLSATAQSWTWSPVNVTPGSYEMTAVGLGFSNVSSPFQVTAGTSSSCLTTSASASTAHSHVGVIVGGALGGVAVIAAAVGACIYFTLRCSSVPGYRWRSFKSRVSREQPAEWSGLSSHVSIPVQSQQAPAKQAVATRPKEDDVPLELLPRLEPNRRKPSVASVTLLSAAPPSPSAQPPPPTPPPPITANTKPFVRLDDELPLPPTVYYPTAESIRNSRLTRSHTLGTTSETTSVMWLRRHALASFIQSHSPTGAGSAAPSSPASQLYKPRESVWNGTMREFEEVHTPPTRARSVERHGDGSPR